MFRIFKDYILSFVAISSSILTIILFIDRISSDTPNTIIIGYILLGGISFYFIVLSHYLLLIWGRKSKYGEILSLINDAFSGIHYLDRETHSFTETVDKFTLLCDNISRSMSLITGTNCSTTIKLFAKAKDKNNNSKIKLLTFARDKHSLNTRLSHRPKYIHWLDENTDFSYIYENFEATNEKYFFSNQLPFLYNYRNSSFKAYGQPYEGAKLIRYLRWPLPYKSTIVVPLCPHNENRIDNVVGYLCVDSPNILAFRLKYDLDLLVGIADGIYNQVLDVATGDFTRKKIKGEK